MENNLKENLIIFNKYFNKKKTSTTNIQSSYVGNTKYFPPVSKEWKDSVYAFNKNNIKNIPIYDIKINEIIKNYFNLYFKPKFIFNKVIAYKKRYLSLNKIFVSKAEIKHTNNKAILTVYVYNREKISLLKKIKKIKRSFFKKIVILINKNSKIMGSKASNADFASSSLYNKTIKFLLKKELKLLRKYKLRFNLNLYKFEEKLLFKLKNLVIKFYNKKVEFNIVNLKSIMLNSEIFTNLFTLKILDKKAVILKMMKIMFNKVVLAKTNNVIEKSPVIKGVDFSLIENNFKSLNLSSILEIRDSDSDITELYKDIFNIGIIKRSYNNINKEIFDSIKYKNISGLRLEVKGRLSKRNRADRSSFKVKWKGGLKNFDSSYKNLSTVNMRGYIESNLDYSIFTSKRNLGTFAVKGWFSGK
jgi:hypothetical protein